MPHRGAKVVQGSQVTFIGFDLMQSCTEAVPTGSSGWRLRHGRLNGEILLGGEGNA